LNSFSSVLAPYEARVAAHASQDGPFAHGAAYTGGKIVPAAEATVPLFDLGFLRSDMTYDVPAVWNGRFFRLDDHIARLKRSCEILRIVPPMGFDEIRDLVVELVRRTQLRDAYVDMLVSRGQMKLGQRDPRMAQPAVYAFVIPYVWILPYDQLEVGGSAVVTRDVRRTPPGAMDPKVKNLQWGDITKGFLEAFDRSAQLPLLPDADGNITEGCYNVFTVHNGVLRTPERGVLEGVTRLTTIEVAQSEGWEVHKGDVPAGSLYTADEIFVTSTAGGIMPVTTLDGVPVGDGKVGPVTRRVWDRYWALHSDPNLSFEISYS
jgi:branched-subunit amino acid aminotransferase/4-amino-4-deoxychorismate lyase